MVTLTRKVVSTAESHSFDEMALIYLRYWLKITGLKPDFYSDEETQKGCTTQGK